MPRKRHFEARDFLMKMTHMLRQNLSVEMEQQFVNNIYSCNLQMYTSPPCGYIKRLCILIKIKFYFIVLKLIEQITKQNYDKSSKDCVNILINELENNGIYDFANLIRTHTDNTQIEREQYLIRNDCISHFMLRSAFSFEHDKWQWFFKQEVRLFKWRVSVLDKDDIYKFININRLRLSTVCQEEKEKIKEDLQMCYNEIENIDDLIFYKRHFTGLINPVKKRQVFLKDGIAYVPETNISWFLFPEFKKVLHNGFAYAREIASNAYGDERITQILSIVSKRINIKRFHHNEHRKVFINELDELSRTSYPLCMRLLHTTLKEKHHLTNGGRIQYTLFLKGIGLSWKDTLQFWKDEFIKKINEKTFEKKYEYHILHLYGEVGKCANYVPFPCFKILNSTVGLRDNHGCPYKCMQLHVLKNVLSTYGLVRPEYYNCSDIASIVELAKEGCYLDACKRYYEITHNCVTEKCFEHPNAYFTHSLKYLESLCSGTFYYCFLC
nr:DNA primase large subunit-like isoform X2 [Nomia melanderi]